MVVIDSRSEPGVATGPAAEVLRLPAFARAWRAVLLLVVAALFVGGTAIGNDDWWPFGPWRMFATATAPSGSVYSLAIEVQIGNDPVWQPADLTPTSVGLNRAEVEGRVPQMTADPAMLGTLARTHARLRPDAPPWRAVRVVRNEVLLSHGAPTGQVRSSTVVSWLGAS